MQYQKQTNYKKLFFVHGMKMLNLSLNELKLIAKSRGINSYKGMSEDRLLSPLNTSESVKESEDNFDDTESTRNEDHDTDEILKTTMPDPTIRKIRK